MADEIKPLSVEELDLVEVSQAVGPSILRALVAEVRQLRTDQSRLADAVAGAYVERDEARTALRSLVDAIAPESEAGDACCVCRCSMPEFDEPHSPDCAYLVARKALKLPEIGQPDRHAEEATP